MGMSLGLRMPGCSTVLGFEGSKVFVVYGAGWALFGVL